MKMIPLEKQSKREQRKFHANKRGSWDGIKPTTRIVESRKVYDRNRIKQADRRNAFEGVCTITTDCLIKLADVYDITIGYLAGRSNKKR